MELLCLKCSNSLPSRNKIQTPHHVDKAPGLASASSPTSLVSFLATPEEWLSGSSSITLRSLLLQEVCSCCSLHLHCSSLGFHMLSSFTLFGPQMSPHPEGSFQTSPSFSPLHHSPFQYPTLLFFLHLSLPAIMLSIHLCIVYLPQLEWELHT